MSIHKQISLAVSLVLSALALSASCVQAAQGETGSSPEPAGKVGFPAPAFASAATTYYVRPDGGSDAQCTGRVDAAYPGGGEAQPCAWNHPFQALSPDGTVRIAGGDTLIIAAGSYELGYGAAGAESCDEAASYDCHMPPVPSGPDSAHPTRLLGAGWDSGCAAPPELWGSGRPWFMLDLAGSSNVELACLEITDHSSCIEDHATAAGAATPYTCNRDNPPYGPWASIGLYAEDSANVRLQDLNIHGLANAGVQAGRLADWTIENVRIVGNGSAGWNGDLVGDGSNSSNSGTLTFRHWTVAWNGCGETYPDRQYLGCWGQNEGGYGDGVGTGLTGGHWIVEDSAFLNNTSDGLDLLYARMPGSIVEVRRTIAEGNAGNQIKFTTAQGRVENSIVVSNCGHFDGMPYWSDDCRAGGDALAFDLQPGGQVALVNNTVTGQGNCLVIANCALDQTCNGSEQVLVRNTLFQGHPYFFDPEANSCFAWYDNESGNPMPANPFVVDHSIVNDVRFGDVDSPCPGANNLCDIAPGIVSTGINTFDAHLLAGSPAINAGAPAGAPSVDFDNRPRDALPDIGAYEWRLVSTWLHLPLIFRSP